MLALTFERATHALLDIPINGATALLVTAPLFLRPTRRGLALLALAAGVLLDVDHAVAARSINLEAMLSLPFRPVTHSLTFAAAAALATGLVARSAVVAWVAFAALLSHLLRDAAGGGVLLFWPLGGVTSVPQMLYVLGLPALLLISYAIRKTRPGAQGSNRG